MLCAPVRSIIPLLKHEPCSYTERIKIPNIFQESGMCCWSYTAEFQIRGGIEDNFKIIFLILNENIRHDTSLEPSHQDRSMTTYVMTPH